MFSLISSLTSVQSGAIKGWTSACANFHLEWRAAQSAGDNLPRQVVGSESENLISA